MVETVESTNQSSSQCELIPLQRGAFRANLAGSTIKQLSFGCVLVCACRVCVRVGWIVVCRRVLDGLCVVVYGLVCESNLFTRSCPLVPSTEPQDDGAAEDIQESAEAALAATSQGI